MPRDIYLKFIFNRWLRSQASDYGHAVKAILICCFHEVSIKVKMSPFSLKYGQMRAICCLTLYTHDSAEHRVGTDLEWRHSCKFCKEYGGEFPDDVFLY